MMLLERERCCETPALGQQEVWQDACLSDCPVTSEVVKLIDLM